MRIICGLGTAARFAILCIVLGIVLGFVLGARVHTKPAPALTVRPSPAVCVDPAVGAPALQPIDLAGGRA